MIEKHHSQLSVRRQCELLAVNRNRLSPRKPKRVAGDESIMKEIDRIYTRLPFYGARKIVLELRGVGIRIGRKRCRRLIKAMGIEALVPKPSTSVPDKQHRKLPLPAARKRCERAGRGLGGGHHLHPDVRGPRLPGCDHGLAHTGGPLVAGVDDDGCRLLHRGVSRGHESGRPSPRHHEHRSGAPSQGSQFTGEDWLEAVEASGARVSMDGKGRWMDKRKAAPGLH